MRLIDDCELFIDNYEQNINDTYLIVIARVRRNVNKMQHLYKNESELCSSALFKLHDFVSGFWDKITDDCTKSKCVDLCKQIIELNEKCIELLKERKLCI